MPSAPAATYARARSSVSSSDGRAEPVRVDAGVDEDVAARDGGDHGGMVRGLRELVLEVHAGDRAEPLDVGGHGGRVGREAVLDVERDRHGQPGEPVREVDGGVRGLRRAVAQPERGRDAEARRPDRREPGGGERGAGRVVPGVGQQQRVARAVQVRERGHRPSTPSTSASACSRPGQARGPAPNGRPVRSISTTLPSGATRRVTFTGVSSPRTMAAVDSHACTSSVIASTPSGSKVRSAASAPGASVPGW